MTMSNDDRASRAQCAVDAYCSATGDRPDESQSRDLLSDLMHLAQREGRSFADELQTALRAFADEGGRHRGRGLVVLRLTPGGAEALADCAEVGAEGFPERGDVRRQVLAAIDTLKRDAGRPPAAAYTANDVHVGGVYRDGDHIASCRGDDIEARAEAERIATALNLLEG